MNEHTHSDTVQQTPHETFSDEQLAVRASARAKLAALGLTEEEINALTGGI